MTYLHYSYSYNNFMNIINSNLEYLLNIAQKIIIQCADLTTKNKYFIIREQVLSTSLVRNKIFYNEDIHSQPAKHFSHSNNTLKESKIINQEYLAKTMSRKSIENFKESRRDTIQRGRIKTYSSKNTQKSIKSQKSSKKQNVQANTEYNALTYLSNILKNAQVCPDLLKTITFLPNSFNAKITQIMKAFSNSLSLIYTQLTQKKDSSDQKVEDDLDSLKIDNKWLIHKLELMLEQNEILRRVIGINTH